MEGHEERKSRAAGLRLGKTQLYPSAKSHQWLKKRAEKKTNKKRASTLMGVAFGIYTLLLAAMWLTGSQRAVTGWGFIDTSSLDERGSDMRGCDKRGNNEQVSYERKSDKRGSDERRSDERGSDERWNNERGSDERGSDER